MRTDDSFRIRPAGRHILTIGRDLIQDSYAAVVELVKNAYDADSPDVKIEFTATADGGGYTLIVSDHGHGMSRDKVINGWMVPSTDDKLKRRESPAGRTMQGSKGIGRYAAAVLGKDLLLETTSGCEKTTLYIEWSEFAKAQFLDDVEILIETVENSEPSGTRLTMTGNEEFLREWDEKQFKKLRYELRKLISPVDSLLSDDPFSISLKVEGFSDELDLTEFVEPFQIFDFFDYRIAGTVKADGRGTLTYSVQKVRNTTDEEILFNCDGPTGCGDLHFDIRVYDREKEAIESLVQRGLTDESGRYVGNLQARQLLNEYNGISVYRNGFRIRPLGDADFDWLRLNKQRVQQPSLRIGSNQVIGYVQIQSEDQSGLIEKSARDGLKENRSFERLKAITKEVIARLETRRFNYRRKAGLSRPVLRVERHLERLIMHDEMKHAIREQLSRNPVANESVNEIIEIINKEEEEKNRVVDEIRQAVATYQSLATLGKIVNVVLHEGRQPLHYFRNQIPNLRYWLKSFQESGDQSTQDKISGIVDGISQNAEFFVELFRRLDPLAAAKRSSHKHLNVKRTIEGVLAVFENEMRSLNVSFEFLGSADFSFPCWKQDMYAIFANLVDNSLYWMKQKSACKRRITIRLLVDNDTLQYIDYCDTGPGIEPDLIESKVIFEPQFSTKPDGTGLGLAIAGEAAERNGLILIALESELGVHFRLEPKNENVT